MKTRNEKVLGVAHFGAYLHRDNGGKARIAAYTAVNKPLAVEAHDETTKIAERTYKIVEDERPELNGSTFYTKDIWNEQTGGDGDSRNSVTKSPYGQDPTEKSGAEGTEIPPWGKVLKNFVDNIAADVRNHVWFIIIIAIIAAVALGLAIAK